MSLSSTHDASSFALNSSLANMSCNLGCLSTNDACAKYTGVAKIYEFGVFQLESPNCWFCTLHHAAPCLMAPSNVDESKLALRNQIVQLSDWWKLQETATPPTTYVLDLRSSEENAKRCLRAPASREPASTLAAVPIPMSVVEQRSFELPARHVNFSILVADADLDRAESFLCGSHRKRPNPWRIDHVLLDTEELWSQAKDLGMVGDPTSASITSKIRRFPLARLWQPDRMVETVLYPLLVKITGSESRTLSKKNPPQVWDLAAGAGRDVAFLAEELLAAGKPYQVIGSDHRYNDKETKIVTDFFGRRGVRHSTRLAKLDLSQWNHLEHAMGSALTTNRVAALFCVRFWKPGLVKDIAQSASIRAGVLFGMSHFCKPSAGAPWNFDHPSEKTVLERNQLSCLFQSQWDILHDEIALDSDHGQTMIHFVARRK